MGERTLDGIPYVNSYSYQYHLIYAKDALHPHLLFRPTGT